MILHLIDDPKFLNGAIELFEKYYPGQNHFFVQIGRNKKAPDKNSFTSDKIFYKAFTRKNDIKFILAYAGAHKITNVLIHNLTTTKAALGNLLKRKLQVYTYWIFYGADLYGRLYEMGKYELIDAENTAKKSSISFRKKLAFWYLYFQNPIESYNSFITKLDYFCFWNEYDYLLLKKNFITNAIHKQFLYYNLIDRNYSNTNYQKHLNKVLVNHSASPNGNHITVLKKIKELLTKNEAIEIITPLSYGSEKIKNDVNRLGVDLFKSNFVAINNYMPMDKYYDLLNAIPVAIFGSRRQEGGGNIFYLLGKGAKIFLRNENNMIHWLKDKGFLVYSFEDDLNYVEDLIPLSISEIRSNINAHAVLFSTEQEAKNISSLINK